MAACSSSFRGAVALLLALQTLQLRLPCAPNQALRKLTLFSRSAESTLSARCTRKMFVLHGLAFARLYATSMPRIPRRSPVSTLLRSMKVVSLLSVVASGPHSAAWPRTLLTVSSRSSLGLLLALAPASLATSSLLVLTVLVSSATRNTTLSPSPSVKITDLTAILLSTSLPLTVPALSRSLRLSSMDTLLVARAFIRSVWSPSTRSSRPRLPSLSSTSTRSLPPTFLPAELALPSSTTTQLSRLSPL
mmetsp:Transcript_19885/g.38997  ORF Transcript_19885/g.38997 Transcript_19885/m.38997 type:complete len:248 (-) Transcript_19885:822-1565(-)